MLAANIPFLASSGGCNKKRVFISQNCIAAPLAKMFFSVLELRSGFFCFRQAGAKKRPDAAAPTSRAGSRRTRRRQPRLRRDTNQSRGCWNGFQGLFHTLFSIGFSAAQQQILFVNSPLISCGKQTMQQFW